MLSVNTIEMWWTIGLPIICLISFMANFLSSVVFFKMRTLPFIIYKYMLAKSVIVCMYLSIVIFVFLIKCNQTCRTIKSNYYFDIVARSYELYLFNYLSSCLGLLDLLVEVVISFERLCIILNWNYLRKVNVVMVILTSLSLIFYLPNLIFFGIKQTNSSSTAFKVTMIKSMDYGFFYEAFTFSALAIRGLLILSIMVIINLINFFSFNNRMHLKRSLSIITPYRAKKLPAGKFKLFKLILFVFYC